MLWINSHTKRHTRELDNERGEGDEREDNHTLVLEITSKQRQRQSLG